jgi:apolipoprotein D and lipocalin family protein
MKPLAHLLAALALAAASAGAAPAGGAPSPGPAELASRLAGTWYEVARTPDASPPACASDIVDRYLPRADGSLALHRSCRTPTGRLQTEEGQAWPTATKAGAQPRLQVSFLPHWLQWLPLRRGEMAVVMLDPIQRYAVLAAPHEQRLWLLSRSPALPPQTLREIVDQLAARGYPAHRLVLTPSADAADWLQTESPATSRRVQLMVQREAARIPIAA